MIKTEREKLIERLDKCITKLETQVEEMKKYEAFFTSCSCLFSEGVEFMSKSEVYNAIKREVKSLE